MRRRPNLPVAAMLAGLGLWCASSPAGAHQLHSTADATLPFAAYALGAAVAVALSFVFVAISDDRTLPEPEPGRVREVWPPLRWLLRLLGLGAWAWVVLQALAGGTSDADVSSLVLWVFGWVGLALVSALVGPAWSWLDPFSTLHDLLAAIGRAAGIHLPGRPPRIRAWEPGRRWR